MPSDSFASTGASARFMEPQLSPRIEGEVFAQLMLRPNNYYGNDNSSALDTGAPVQQ
jgi:hypothetical protein